MPETKVTGGNNSTALLARALVTIISHPTSGMRSRSLSNLTGYSRTRTPEAL